MTATKNSMRIRYEYEQVPNLHINYAHGVWGGVNSQGELELNFYTESEKLPLVTERFIEENGEISRETTPLDPTTKVITRHIHSRLILNYMTARGIMGWLGDKLELLDAEDEINALVYSEEKPEYQ